MLVQSPIVRLAVTLVLVAGGLSSCARRATAESTTTDNGCRAWLHRSETRLAVASRHPDFEIWWISPSFSGEAEWTFRGTFCRARLHRVRGLPIPSESTKIGASHPVPFLPTLCKRGAALNRVDSWLFSTRFLTLVASDFSISSEPPTQIIIWQ